MSAIQYKPLTNNLPLTYEQICNLETALALAKAQLKAAHDTDPEGIITKKIAQFDALYNHVSAFNKSHKWTQLVYPPEIERILAKRK